MKRFVIFLIVLFNVNLVFSQNTFNKQYHFDGIAALGNGMLVTDSCYYVSGIVVDTINNNIYDGLFLAKMNLEGELLTTNIFLDTLSDFENWNTPLLYHDSLFTSIGYGFDSLMYLYWMRIDTTYSIRNFKKHRSYYSPEDYYIRPVDAVYDSIDSIYYITTSIGKYEANGTLNDNISILALDNNGEYIWEEDYGGSWANDPYSLIFQNGELIVGTQRSNHNLTRINLEYYSKIFAVDTLGQVLWQWQSPHSVQQGANDMLATDDGGLVVVSGRGFLERVNPETDYAYWDRGVVFKLDSNHQVEWECEFTEPYPNPFNKFNKIVEATDNFGYVAAGSMWVWLNEDNASYLGWLAKVSPQGDSLWSRKLFYYEYPDSLEYEHEIHDLHATPDGGYIMSGKTLDREGISRPISQAWYIKVDSEGCLIPGCGVVDTREPDSEGPPLLLYPNPTTDYLNVYMGDTGGKEWSFVIYNSLGQQMGTYRAHSAHTTYMIDVGHWPSGQYFLRVSDSAGVEMRSYGFFRD